MTFSDFNFDDSLFEGLNSMGFKTPTPIQAETIPIIQSKHDLIACAQTGTGKTASYLLPVMDAICRMEHRPIISALVLAPTRELAVQIDQQVEGLAYFTGITSIAIYGGGDGIGYEQQRKALRDGVDIVIATPGRLIAHLNSGAVRLDEIKFLVLDEADRMLDMGFKDDINRIVRQVSTERQTMLFSATMPPKIRTFAKALLKHPKQVNIAISKPAEGITQRHYRVPDEQKIALLKQLLQSGTYSSVIVFSSTKEKVKILGRELGKLGLSVEPFHSDLPQDEREKILLRFKNKQLPILIGTDVLSRGIDVEGIDLVVNYDVPPDPEDYIHRIGRTARAARTGTAITFVNQRDTRRFAAIERLMDSEVEEGQLPEGMAVERTAAATANTAKRRSSKPKKKRNFRQKGRGNGQPAAEGMNNATDSNAGANSAL
ncbi:DEAD/DEAH box helicase [Parapedobacter sp. ISTM3]|uniref:Superfamily II DNA and RNA helicase n=1 Tax=Parapedobacter luteus TaxID=623280 RepID=A0A1T5FFE0_9SPHI|nr:MULTISPECIES: DEAD/DEAH box helicase [Parapedobacter]MBK1441469.1 DEAD/DEAH box helicase [Parapedobacter sp. ISTM3]SKB94873.1 Superfamily II DNA and RNA helicase [Parapedobacter luteus]